MYAVVRTYSGAGAKELFSLLEQRMAEVEAVMRSVPGLVSYTLVRSTEGGIAVTVCQDKAGADAAMLRWPVPSAMTRLVSASGPPSNQPIPKPNAISRSPARI
ncbi:MAG: hypothetical protein WB500_00960, partial [Rhodoplanes sp.]